MKKFMCIVAYLLTTMFLYSKDSQKNEEDVVKLEQMTVTASRVKEKKEKTSASVILLNREDIEKSSAKTLGEIIAQRGLGGLKKYSGMLTGNMSIRGLSSGLGGNPFTDQILFLVDGVPSSVSNLSMYPTDSIEKIEILKGANSVLYGNNAMGGVINIITQKVKKEQLTGTVKLEGGEFEHFLSSVNIFWKKGDFDLAIYGMYTTTNDYEVPNYGTLKNSGMSGASGKLSLGYNFSKTERLNLNIEGTQFWEIEVPGTISSVTLDDYAQHYRHKTDISYKTKSLKVNYYYAEDRRKNFTISFNDESYTQYLTQGFSLQNIFSLPAHIQLLAGLDWKNLNLSSGRTAGNAYNPNANYHGIGGFLDLKKSLLKDKLNLNLGARYDHFFLNIIETDVGTVITDTKAETFGAPSFRGGISYSLTSKIRTKANVGNGFRSPAPHEKLSSYVLTSFGTDYTGNPDLKSEKSITFDYGWGYTEKYIDAEVNYFQTRFSDKITQISDPVKTNTKTYININGAQVQGIEFLLSYDVGLSLKLPLSIKPSTSLTYHFELKAKEPQYFPKDKNNISVDQLLDIPVFSGSIGLLIGQKNWSINFQGRYLGNKKENFFDSTTFSSYIVDTDSYWVFDVKASYKPVKFLEIFAVVENINNKYYEYVILYPMPGLNYRGGIKYNF